ncbi:MAG TPA: glycosyltransferase family 2 protein [Lachnospiraceae bacterium]|nr:glycosyltransferase family 2 protein [Lachnospiraceae bacterium]
MKPLISIIIPVYNVEKYLGQCMKSVSDQTSSDLEIILVDDGSTDRSGEICDSWKKTDSRVTVIHKSNGGLSDARNVGIEAASGDWLMFIDSDDYVSDHFCEHALHLVEESHADIGVFDYQFCWEDHCERSKESITGILDNQEAMYQLLIGNTKNYAWNKIYKRDLFRNVRYPASRVWEDIGTTYKLFAAAEKVHFSSEVLYFYRQRSESISYDPPARALFDIYEEYQEQYLFCQTNYPDFIDIVWDNVIGYALICCIKNYSTVRKWDKYRDIKACLRKDRRVPGKMSFSKKIMLTIFRVSEGLFYKVCAMVYFLKRKGE